MATTRTPAAAPLRFSGAPLPSLRRIMVNPAWMYLAQSAILSRMAVAFARVWMNRPGNIEDPKLNLDQKRLSLWERAFVEVVGTPAFFVVMHATQDLLGMVLERAGIWKNRIHAPNVRPSVLDQANAVLHSQVGRRNLWGRFLFRPASSGLTAYHQALEAHGLGHLLKNEAFVQAAEQWFRRSKLFSSGLVVAGMLSSAVFAGAVIQKLNNNWFSPMVSRLLNRHLDVRLSDQDRSVKV